MYQENSDLVSFREAEYTKLWILEFHVVFGVMTRVIQYRVVPSSGKECQVRHPTQRESKCLYDATSTEELQPIGHTFSVHCSQLEALQDGIIGRAF